jgi:hypothetical protein
MSHAAEASVLGRRGLPLAGAARRAAPAPWFASFAFPRSRAPVQLYVPPAEPVEPQWLQLDGVALDEPPADEPPREHALREKPPLEDPAIAPDLPTGERRIPTRVRSKPPAAGAGPVPTNEARQPADDDDPTAAGAPEKERQQARPSPRPETAPGERVRPSPAFAERSSPGSPAPGVKRSRRMQPDDEAAPARGAPLGPAAEPSSPEAVAASKAFPPVRMTNAPPEPAKREPAGERAPRTPLHTTMPMGAPAAVSTRKAGAASAPVPAARRRERAPAAVAPERQIGARIGTVHVVIRAEPPPARPAAPPRSLHEQAAAQAPATRAFRSPWTSWRRGD